MDKIEVYNDDSSDSVKEMDPPKKLPPPLIDLTSDDAVEIWRNEPNRESIQKSKREPNRTSPTVIVTIHEDIKHGSNEEYPSHWTHDMIRFYNDEWDSETHFDVEKIQAEMNKDPSLWHVSPRDLLFTNNRKIRSRAKCWNCCQYGHTSYYCQEKLHVLKCHMCGGVGHIEEACPSSICLTCGNRMAIFVLSCLKCIQDAKSFCSRCYMFGHNAIDCTDNWRRFHSTIGTTTVEIPDHSVYKPDRDLWCCNCGGRGHNQINCIKRKDHSYPETFPYVASYETNFTQDVYSAAGREPVASTSTSWRGRRHNFEPLDRRPLELKCVRNLMKLNKRNKKKKKKKKKNKSNGSSLIEIPTIYPH